MRFFRRQFYRQLLGRVAAWINERRRPRVFLIPMELHTTIYPSGIHRDVSPNGVTVYSLCASCGARLHASATLCEECAQKQSRPARPY